MQRSFDFSNVSSLDPILSNSAQCGKTKVNSYFYNLYYTNYFLWQSYKQMYVRQTFIRRSELCKVVSPFVYWFCAFEFLVPFQEDEWLTTNICVLVSIGRERTCKDVPGIGVFVSICDVDIELRPLQMQNILTVCCQALELLHQHRRLQRPGTYWTRCKNNHFAISVIPRQYGPGTRSEHFPWHRTWIPAPEMDSVFTCSSQVVCKFGLLNTYTSNNKCMYTRTCGISSCGWLLHER